MNIFLAVIVPNGNTFVNLFTDYLSVQYKDSFEIQLTSTAVGLNIPTVRRFGEFTLKCLVSIESWIHYDEIVEQLFLIGTFISVLEAVMHVTT